MLPSNLRVIPSETLGYLQVGILQVKVGGVPVHVGVLHFFAAPRVGHTVPGRHVLPAEVVVLFAKAISASVTFCFLYEFIYEIVAEKILPVLKLDHDAFPRIGGFSINRATGRAQFKAQSTVGCAP